MIAVLSATEHDWYSMPLPFAVYSWKVIGIDCLVITPEGDSPKLELAKKYCAPTTIFQTFKAREDKQATYAQVARLYVATNPQLFPWEVLITGDSDMAVFGDYLIHPPALGFKIFGADLVPDKQWPICYISGSIASWDRVMEVKGRTLQECLDDALGHEEMQNMRGCLWSRDQETIFNQLQKYKDVSVEYINRAKPGTQFASHRVDRDDINWRAYVNDELVDAHLWRPLHTDENFSNVIELFTMKYPNADLSWMYQYREEFLKL